MDEQQTPAAAPTPVAAPAVAAPTNDVEQNKGMAALAYILFFVPLLAAPDSQFARYHANQGLILLIVAIIVNVVGGMVPVIGWFLILPVGSIFVLVLWIMGILNAVNGKEAPLPIIGNFTLIK
jgi:uncharacterized membrane protein